MNRNFKYYSLEDIPKQFLKNFDTSSLKNNFKTYYSKEISHNKSNQKLNNSFDNIWIILIILVILDII